MTMCKHPQDHRLDAGMGRILCAACGQLVPNGLNDVRPPKKNTNCLEGIACPRCKQRDSFRISVFGYVEITDSGVQGTLDAPEWDNTSYIICPQCRHNGTVSEFTEES